MSYALPLLIVVLAGCANEPPKEEPWLFCVRAPTSLECLTNVDGKIERISIEDPEPEPVEEPGA